MKKTDARRERLAQLKQDFNEIVDMVAQAPDGEVLDHVERRARLMALNMYRGVLQDAVNLRGKEWKRKSVPTCTCGAKMRMAYRQTRGVLTLLGEMTFKRRYYYCDTCKRSRIPFDEEMGLAEFSDGVTRAAVMCGLKGSFEKAVHQLVELAEVHISKETVRQLTENAAGKLQDAQESGQLLAQESDAKFDADDRAYVSMDGTSVNTIEDQWREMKVGSFYDQEKGKQHYLATLLDCHEFGQIMRRHAGNLKVGHAGEIVACGDGAKWIWNQMEVNFPMADYQFLDFYHLSEKVFACAWALYGSESPHGKRWARDQMHLVKHQGGKRFLSALRKARKLRKKSASQQALTKLINYLEFHIERTQYPQLKAKGIDIGTGPQESACKNVIGERLKGRGMRWKVVNVEAMGRLRAYAVDFSKWEKRWKALKRVSRSAAAAA